MVSERTFLLLATILHSVAGAPESVFGLEGNSVTLIMPPHDGLNVDDASWVFNRTNGVVKYFLRNGKVQLRVSSHYEGRVEFDIKTFSLELKNLQKVDTGVYKGEINTAEKKGLFEYRLSVFESAVVPVLAVVSNWSTADSCKVMLTCTTHNLLVNFHCGHRTCSQVGGAYNEGLTVFIKSDTFVCNHSNPVSWNSTTLKTELFCPLYVGTPQCPPGDEQKAIYSVLGVLLFINVGAVGLFFFLQKTCRTSGGNKAHPSACINVFKAGPVKLFSEKSGNQDQPETEGLMTMSPLSDTKRQTPSTTPSQRDHSVVEIANSSVKRRPPHGRSPRPFTGKVERRRTVSAGHRLK